MVERDDMPGMAADSHSLRNVSVATENAWVVGKYCVITPFANAICEGGKVGVGCIPFINSIKKFCILYRVVINEYEALRH